MFSVRITAGDRQIFIGTHQGQGIRFAEKDGRPMGRETTGVIGVTLKKNNDYAVEMDVVEEKGHLLTVTEKGYGKLSSSYEYRITNRGGKGIVAMDIWEGKKGAETIREKTGYLVASFPVGDDDQLMLVTNGGQLIRTKVDGIRIAGRATQGVIVFDTAEDERVVSVERLSEEGEENGA